MGIPIRVLIVEDVEDDAELLVQELRRKGYDPLHERVETKEAMLESLERETWDVIICDYSMPGFNAISALELMRKIQNDLPFILVSGTIGEEVAVEAMKAGAHDYIMKNNLSRFVPAIERELAEYKERCHVKQMEDAIQTLVKGTVGVTGQEFFDRVVSSMCEWLGTEYAFIGQIEEGKTVRALSMKADGKYISDFVYDLNGTPCGSAVESGCCIYPEGVSKLFPDDKGLIEMNVEGYVGVSLKDKSGKAIGMLWTASRHKLNIPPRTADVMDIIAAKASAEIERMRAEEKIKASLREKEVLLKEIHHRVKNNMQIVSSLLNLQAESVDDENTRQILKKSQNRVKSMALVHEKLYQTEDLSSVDFGEYTRSLTTRLLHSFGEITRGVQLVIEMDEVHLDVNKAIPCGLIINEIVTNSFKHAFPDSTTGVDKNKFEGKGVIKVSMCKNADPESHTSADVETLAKTAGRSSASAEIAPGQAGTVELVVGDNGVGLPEGLDFRNTKTLGMELVVTLVGQLEGSIEYANNGGAEFKITFEV